jgi:eukaryotic-like serine/threonine-protein kinase
MISVGQTVGNYRITAKLGEGGMGVVYLAEHPVIGKKVAIKAIHPELSKNPEVISRFMTEAKSVNQIGNEHIVDISDFGNTDDGEFFFVMEFLQGDALSDRISHDHRFQAPRALKIGAQVADALAASHEHGIIHRDLKPENIYLITRGSVTDFVKVLDFGLAKLTQGDEKVSHKTRTGSVMGTPYYMSPEQCEGRADVDHRSDIYALGVILFEMMTGKVPFGGEGYGEIIVKHITQAPPSLRAINPLLEEHHEKVVLRALSKDRNERYQSMREFRTAMLDPQGYALNAPSLQSMGSADGVPAARPASADALSGQVVFGGDQKLGAKPRPVPTTFGQGAGELADDLDAPKSRKGLLAIVAGSVVVAGIGAFLILGRGSETPPATTAEKPAEAIQPVVPAKPETVGIKFNSDPSGAQVLIKATGAVIGTTPMEYEVPKGSTALEIVLRKPGFEDKTLSIQPDEDSRINSELSPVKAAAEPEEQAKPVVAGGKPSRGRPQVIQKEPAKAPTSATKPKTRKGPLDEDAVLEPSFE